MAYEDIKGYSFDNLTADKHQEIARKGGLASVKARRKKKALKETLEVFLNMPIKSGKHIDIEAIKNFAALKIAKNLKSIGYPIEDISKVTGLTPEEIEKL